MAIRLVEQDDPTPANDVVEWAQDLVDDAAKGEIVGVVYVVCRRDGRWATGSRGQQNALETIGRLEGLKVDLLKKMEL